FAREGRGPEQGHGYGLDGHDQVARKRKEDRAPRCLWACQRRDGLSGRRSLGRREERALPASKEHLRCETVIAGTRQIGGGERADDARRAPCLSFYPYSARRSYRRSRPRRLSASSRQPAISRALRER